MILDVIIALAVYDALKKICWFVVECMETYFYFKNKDK